MLDLRTRSRHGAKYRHAHVGIGKASWEDIFVAVHDKGWRDLARSRGAWHARREAFIIMLMQLWNTPHRIR